jgi:hypothetical protein
LGAAADADAEDADDDDEDEDEPNMDKNELTSEELAGLATDDVDVLAEAEAAATADDLAAGALRPAAPPH